MKKRKDKRKKEYRFYFKIELCGVGTDVDEAWQDAVEAFMQDPGCYDEAKKGDCVK